MSLLWHDIEMPGARMTAFTAGAISERLAESIIGTMAFTTEVPYREDVGHDLHCVLYVPSNDGTMLNAGPSFNVQVKSNRRALSYRKLHSREWLATQRSPFFVCTVDRDKLSCEVYSTWNVHNGILRYGYGAPDDHGSSVQIIKLVLPPSRKQWTGFLHFDDPKTNGGILSIPLGPPILRLTPDSVKDPEAAKKYAQILKTWIDFEHANIVRTAMGMYWTLGPVDWRTNIPLEEYGKPSVGFFANPKNLYPDPSNPYRHTVTDNFVKSAVALTSTAAALRDLIMFVLVEGCGVAGFGGETSGRGPGVGVATTTIAGGGPVAARFGWPDWSGV